MEVQVLFNGSQIVALQDSLPETNYMVGNEILIKYIDTVPLSYKSANSVYTNTINSLLACTETERDPLFKVRN